MKDQQVEAGLVLGLPRGGVVVAAAVAQILRLPLDVLIVRKIGHPIQREFALGALAEGDVLVHVGGDNVEGGRIAARYLIEKLGNKGAVIQLEGTPGASPAIFWRFFRPYKASSKRSLTPTFWKRRDR